VAAPNFKPAFDALAERLQLSSGAVRVSRQNLPAASFPEKPAIVVLAESLGGLETDPARPASIWRLGAVVVIHARSSADDLVPDDANLDLVSGIVDALRWREGEPRSDGHSYWTTLGGAVLRAWLDGDILVEDYIDVRAAIQVQITLHVKMLFRP
jgi:hypothetical protein